MSGISLDPFIRACSPFVTGLFSEPHVGSKPVGDLIAEDDANGVDMERITNASLELAAHCLANEEGLGRKANQQQRWLDLALSLKACEETKDRTDDIESAQVTSCSRMHCSVQFPSVNEFMRDVCCRKRLSSLHISCTGMPTLPKPVVAHAS